MTRFSDNFVALSLTPPQGTHLLKHNRAILGKTCGVLPFGIGGYPTSAGETLTGPKVRTRGLEWDLGKCRFVYPCSSDAEDFDFIGMNPHFRMTHFPGSFFRFTSTDGQTPSAIGGLLSTSNHLIGDGTVEVETDLPVYWSVELKTE